MASAAGRRKVTQPQQAKSKSSEITSRFELALRPGNSHSFIMRCLLCASKRARQTKANVYMHQVTDTAGCGLGKNGRLTNDVLVHDHRMLVH